jgi:excinuclease ABC subunit C
MSLAGGIQTIKDALKQVPHTPGVYRMLDESDTVLYVGKAKNLPKRVTNYTQPERLPYRIKQMVSKTAKLVTVSTETEVDALLLEADLIKTYHPRYNILLKDDKSFPYILLTANHDFPRVTKHRGERKDKGTYFGPFPSAGAVNSAITDLQKVFLIRPCTDSFFKARTRPCMEYQIKRCSAPCVDQISKADYSALVSQAIAFLRGKSRQVQTFLQEKMQAASSTMQYELAAQYRDRIQALNHIQSKRGSITDKLDDVDVIALYREHGLSCIQVFFYRGGQCFGNQPFFPSASEDMPDEEIMASFIIQYYRRHTPPTKILVSHEVEDASTLVDALSHLAERKVYLTAPQKGDNRQVIDNAINNAKTALNQRVLDSNKQKELLVQVAKVFDLPKPLKRIEVYDNSHIMGKHDVGAMIVAGEDGFMRSAYRRFNIKGAASGTGDDYAMMREVIHRRFSRLLQDAPKYQEGVWPDLLIIDGGLGQMSAVLHTLAELGLQNTIHFVCMSKGVDRNAGKEQFHTPDKGTFTIPFDSAVMYYLQRLRDESHNYVIGSHRKKRQASLSKSLLDDIPGIGAAKKRDLLQHFGSAQAALSASIDDLQKVKGISQALARTIYGIGHGQ